MSAEVLGAHLELWFAADQGGQRERVSGLGKGLSSVAQSARQDVQRIATGGVMGAMRAGHASLSFSFVTLAEDVRLRALPEPGNRGYFTIAEQGIESGKTASTGECVVQWELTASRTAAAVGLSVQCDIDRDPTIGTL